MMGSKSHMFSVELSAMLHLYFIVCEPAIFDAAVDIGVGVHVVAKVTRDGLIDLLVAVAASTSLGAWRAGVMM